MAGFQRSPSPARAKRPATKGTRHGNGAGQGDGWGGPAKGAGRGSPPMLVAGCGLSKREAAAEKKARRDEVAAELEEIILGLARDADRDETRLAAAARLHAIYEGQPTARQTHEISGLEGGPIELKDVTPAEAYRRIKDG